MMKKIAFLIIAFLFVNNSAIAGDIAFAIMQGKQDAFVIVKIDAIENEFTTVSVKKILMGAVDNNKIKIEPFTFYGGIKAKVGDYGVLSINKKEKYYVLYHGAYKASSADYKTLKLSRAKDFIIVEMIQEFINNGKYLEADQKIKAKAVRDQGPKKSEVNAEPKEKFEYSTFIVPAVLVLVMVSLIALRKRKH